MGNGYSPIGHGQLQQAFRQRGCLHKAINPQVSGCFPIAGWPRVAATTLGKGEGEEVKVLQRLPETLKTLTKSCIPLRFGHVAYMGQLGQFC